MADIADRSYPTRAEGYFVEVYIPQMNVTHTYRGLLHLNQVFLSLLIISSVSFGQTSDTTAINAYKEEAKHMLSFVEFTFNTLGDPFSTAQQKETIIRQSYLKAFRDDEVQIEDDLIEGRSTVTNKDVQAYLQDIDFFFEQVQFTFLVEEITHEVNEEGELYFKVHYSRNLKGITSEGDSLNSIQPRFIEINLDRQNRDLKIVSMYTTKLSEQEDLKNWWNDMPLAWKNVFAPQLALNDSLSMESLLQKNELLLIGDTLFYDKNHSPWGSEDNSASMSLDALNEPYKDTMVIASSRLFADLKRVQSQTALDLTAKDQLDDLVPLSKMTQLKELNLSGTDITSLFPLRNLTRLEKLDVSFSKITDLSPLKFAIGLREIVAHNTNLSDLTPLQYFPRLRSLDCSFSSVVDLTPLTSLTQLRELNFQQTSVKSIQALADLSQLEQLRFSFTGVEDLSPLRNKSSLRFLYISGTSISDLSPLSTAQNLILIHCEQSQIASLQPLKALPNLKKVYCDNTPIDRQEAAFFMAQKPGCLVIFESSALIGWWKQMPSPWQTYFRAQKSMQASPSKEELHQLANITRIDISGNTEIQSLLPLQMLRGLTTILCSGSGIDSLGGIGELLDLQILDASNTSISNLSSIQYLKNLKQVSFSSTQVSSLESLSGLERLEKIECDNSPIKSLTPLKSLTALKMVYCDNSEIDIEAAKEFLQASPNTLIIFHTDHLTQWWNRIGQAWQGVFQQHIKCQPKPTREELHQMMLIQVMALNGNSDLLTLTPLSICIRLEQLRIENSRISDLQPLAELSTLHSLTISRTPISDLSSLSTLMGLTYLNIENTPVEDLMAISGLTNLQEVNFGGTQVKDLRPLEYLLSLKRIDCSNTPIKKLKPLYGLPKLIQLKCFNTRVPQKKVEAFDMARPSCEVVYY